MSDREREAAAAIGELYERRAAKFADARRNRPWLERALFEHFARGIRKGGSVLDLGCGCGAPIAQFFVERGHGITGIDTSPSLVAAARALLSDHAFEVGDMRRLDLGRRFDAIVAWDSFFHLTHEAQRAMFDVFRRHAADSSVLLVNTGPAHGVAFGDLFGETLFHASLSAAEYRARFDGAAFDVIEHQVEDVSAGGRTWWIARTRSGRGE